MSTLTWAHLVCLTVIPNSVWYSSFSSYLIVEECPEAASKIHYFTRGRPAILPNHFSFLGMAAHRVSNRYLSYHNQCGHVTDGCLVWIPANCGLSVVYTCCQSFVLPNGSPALFVFMPSSFVLCLYFSALIFIPCGQPHSNLLRENKLRHPNIKNNIFFFFFA